MGTRGFASAASLAFTLLAGVWCLGAGTVNDDMRPVSDREATRFTGGDCSSITPEDGCGGTKTKNGMPETCPSATFYKLANCDGNVSALIGGPCQTPCSTSCGFKITSYKDCDGEKHNF